jgi:transposase-like protein
MFEQLDLFDLIPSDDRIYEFEEACRLAAKCEKSLAPIRAQNKMKSSRSKGLTRQELHFQRRRIATEVLAEKGSVSEFARRAGIVSSWASEWLKRFEPDLHRELLDQSHPVMLSRERRIARLKAVQLAEALGIPLCDVAQQMNMEPGTLKRWLATWAPEGIEDALELELDEDLLEVA